MSGPDSVWQIVDGLPCGAIPPGDYASQLCERAGLSDGRPMVVAVARLKNRLPDNVWDAGQLSELASALREVIAPDNFGRLVDVRVDEVVVIASHAASPGATVTKALRNQLTDFRRISNALLGIGVGLDVLRIADLPRSYREADIAFGIPNSSPSVVHLAEVGIDTYFRSTADLTARRLAKPLPNFPRQGVLAATVQVFAASNLNVKACARKLDIHSNTVYHRLNRVKNSTGLDPRKYRDLTELITSMALADEHGDLQPRAIRRAHQTPTGR